VVDARGVPRYAATIRIELLHGVLDRWLSLARTWSGKFTLRIAQPAAPAPQFEHQRR
jgi:hypothetical protein